MEWSLVLSSVFVVTAGCLLVQCRVFHRQGQAAHDAAMQRYREAQATLRQAEQYAMQAQQVAQQSLCAACGMLHTEEETTMRAQRLRTLRRDPLGKAGRAR